MLTERGPSVIARAFLFPQFKTPERVMELTIKECALLRKIYFSQYHDGRNPYDSSPVWAELDTKVEGGIFASLLEKGLVGFQDAPKKFDKMYWLLPAAKAYHTIFLTDPKQSKQWQLTKLVGRMAGYNASGVVILLADAMLRVITGETEEEVDEVLQDAYFHCAEYRLREYTKELQHIFTQELPWFSPKTR